MLENWLIPSIHENGNSLGCINELIQKSLKDLANAKGSIFLISDTSEFAQHSKNAFYTLKNHFKDLKIFDLGTLKNENAEFIIGLLRELLPLEGRIVVLSDEINYIDSIFRALEYSNDHISLALVNSDLNGLEEDRTARSLQSKNLLNLSVIGYQRHFCSHDILAFIHESFVHHLSYGEVRNELSKVEPILRNSNAINIDLGAMKSNNGMPNGFDALEMCQIAKYAGMGSSLKVLNISNVIGCKSNEVAPIVGQMLWYFVEGQSLKEPSPLPKESDYFQEHLVQTDYSNYSFTFWKSIKSNRWWFEIPNPEGQRGNIYPCNKEDYELACRNEVSEYLLNQINLDH